MKLKIGEIKNIQFDVDISGAEANMFTCRLIILSNDVEYGFPCEITNDHISTKLPVIKNIIPNLKNDDVLKCKLEIFKPGYYLQAWEGTLEVEVGASSNINIIAVKEEIVEYDPEFEQEYIPLRESHNHSSLKTDLKNNEKDEFIKFLMKKINENKIIHKNTSLKNRKNIKETIKRKANRVMNPVSEADMIQQKLSSMREKKIANVMPVKNKQSTEITLESCTNLMAKHGMTKKKSQDNLLEKAKEIGGDSIISIYDTIEKLLGVSSQKNTLTEMYDKTMRLRNE